MPCLGFTIPEEETWEQDGSNGSALNKYTPFGMLNELDFGIGTERALPAEEYLVEGACDQFADYQLHLGASASRDRCIERRLQVRDLVHDGLASSRVVIITLGLVETWFDTRSGIYLNSAPSHNMVRRYPNRFLFEVLSYEQCLSCIETSVSLLRSNRQDVRILLTVSPVPMQRTFTGSDVIVANSYSKSVLRVVAESVCQRHAFVDYFPSYESVMLSEPLTAWKDDQVHVTQTMIDENVDRMLEAYSPASGG